MHRDLKPSKILLTNNYKTVKIGGLNLIKKFKGNFLFSNLGTNRYKAPEIHENSPYTKSADIWSLACTLLHLITKEKPYF